MMDKLRCSKCEDEKLTSEFSPRTDRKRGYASRCKLCQAYIQRQSYYSPKMDGNQNCTKCKHDKHITEFFANRHSKTGRDSQCKSCRHQVRMNRLNTNKEARIVENLRRRTRAVLAGTNKSDSTLNLIGCSPIELKRYIESKFTDGMTWDNYGLWHIDHIRPCNSFNLTLELEQRECFNYNNLQPLWADDNLSKADKYNE